MKGSVSFHPFVGLVLISVCIMLVAKLVAEGGQSCLTKAAQHTSRMVFLS